MVKLVLDHVAGFFCQPPQKRPFGESSLDRAVASRKRTDGGKRKYQIVPFSELRSLHNDAALHRLSAHCLPYY